jgi:hypothetical protein
VRHDPKLQGALVNLPEDPPSFSIDELHEVSSFDELKPPGTGYIFFSEEPGA